MRQKKASKGKAQRVEPEFFYKYTSLGSVKDILGSCSIKVTDPTTFNDPFDCNVPLFNLSKAGVFNIVKREFGSASGQANNPIFKNKINALRPSLEKLSEEILEDTVKLTSGWGDLLPQLRVLSLTTKADNILMWSHYANFHKGATLKFYAHADSFSGAVKVRYEDGDKLLSNFLEAAITALVRRITRSDTGGELNNFASALSTQTFNLLLSYLSVKRKDWAYESEYRVILTADNNKVVRDFEKNLDVVGFNPKDLCEIIFGVASDPLEVQAVEALVSTRFPWVKLSRAKKSGLELVL